MAQTIDERNDLNFVNSSLQVYNYNIEDLRYIMKLIPGSAGLSSSFYDDAQTNLRFRKLGADRFLVYDKNYFYNSKIFEKYGVLYTTNNSYPFNLSFVLADGTPGSPKNINQVLEDPFVKFPKPLPLGQLEHCFMKQIILSMTGATVGPTGPTGPAGPPGTIDLPFLKVSMPSDYPVGIGRGTLYANPEVDPPNLLLPFRNIERNTDNGKFVYSWISNTVNDPIAGTYEVLNQCGTIVINNPFNDPSVVRTYELTVCLLPINVNIDGSIRLQVVKNQNKIYQYALRNIGQGIDPGVPEIDPNITLSPTPSSIATVIKKFTTPHNVDQESIQLTCFFTLTEPQATISVIATADVDESIVYFSVARPGNNWMVLRQIS